VRDPVLQQLQQVGQRGVAAHAVSLLLEVSVSTEITTATCGARVGVAGGRYTAVRAAAPTFLVFAKRTPKCAATTCTGTVTINDTTPISIEIIDCEPGRGCTGAQA
jgi:hypothetical protein